MGLIDLWADGRDGMASLGRSLDGDAAEAPVPACPGWTIRQVFAHQAGVTADVLAGRLDDAPSDAWTERQVAARAGDSLAEILDEWDETAPRLVDRLRTVGDEGLDPRFVMDLWHHTQDVRVAVGLPGQADGPLTDWVVERSRYFLARTLGDEVVPAVEGHELARAMLGRRSTDQIRAWPWPVDEVDELVAQVPVFAPRPDPLVEAFA